MADFVHMSLSALTLLEKFMTMLDKSLNVHVVIYAANSIVITLHMVFETIFHVVLEIIMVKILLLF